MRSLFIYVDFKLCLKMAALLPWVLHGLVVPTECQSFQRNRLSWVETIRHLRNSNDSCEFEKNASEYKINLIYRGYDDLEINKLYETPLLVTTETRLYMIPKKTPKTKNKAKFLFVNVNIIIIRKLKKVWLGLTQTDMFFRISYHVIQTQW